MIEFELRPVSCGRSSVSVRVGDEEAPYDLAERVLEELVVEGLNEFFLVLFCDALEPHSGEPIW